MRVISLGWGVQSFAMACISALGVLPPVDAAIHADTTHERAETYALAREWTPWLVARGVQVITVTGGRREAVEEWATVSVMIPAFTCWPDGSHSGTLRRQCTSDWKIAPIRRWLQKHRNGETVEMWLGITLVEWRGGRDRRSYNRRPSIQAAEDVGRRGSPPREMAAVPVGAAEGVG